MHLIPIPQHTDKTLALYASEDCQFVLQMYDDFYPKIGYVMPGVGYFVVREDQIVGSCSFVGQPQQGRIEIAYYTFQAFEGQGIASFACRELISIACQADPDVTITARTAPEHNASTRILANNQFIFSEIVQDEEIGDAWLWVHHRIKPDMPDQV